MKLKGEVIEVINTGDGIRISIEAKIGKASWKPMAGDEMRDEQEVEAAADRAASLSHKPSRYSGMSYEDGLRDALEWVLEMGEENEDPTK